jgi:hypothetical protein
MKRLVSMQKMIKKNSVNTSCLGGRILVSNNEVDAWKEYIGNLEDQDRRDLYHAIACMKDEFHLYRGTWRHPAYLFMNRGKCRLKLNFSDGLTEISFNCFNVMYISNKDLVEFLKCFSKL